MPIHCWLHGASKVATTSTCLTATMTPTATARPSMMAASTCSATTIPRPCSTNSRTIYSSCGRSAKRVSAGRRSTLAATARYAFMSPTAPSGKSRFSTTNCWPASVLTLRCGPGMSLSWCRTSMPTPHIFALYSASSAAKIGASYLSPSPTRANAVAIHC
ncbi:hypothetical protein D3C80_1467360 [compost metagenome]